MSIWLSINYTTFTWYCHSDSNDISVKIDIKYEMIKVPPIQANIARHLPVWVIG